MVDDRRGLSPGIRIAVETLAAVAPPAWGTVRSAWLVHSICGWWRWWCSAPMLSTYSTALDGLAGLAALVAGLGTWWLASSRGLDDPTRVMLAAALGGFLILSWHEAQVVLGDKGAYMVGIVLAFGILRASPGGFGSGFVIASAFLGVVALDLLFSIFRKAVRRRPIFSGTATTSTARSGRAARADDGTLAELLVVMVVVVTDALLNGAALLLRSAVGIVTLGVLSLAGFSRADGELQTG